MITEPNTWKNPNTHYFRSVKKQMVQTVDFIGKFNYWRNNEILLKKGIITMHLPVTTGSISSPMRMALSLIGMQVNVSGL